MKVIFSHGKESGPWGSKIKALAEVAQKFGCDVESIDYRGIESPDERVTKLNNYLSNEVESYLLVGSSMGGYISLVAAQPGKQQGVFLLAPALYMSDYLVQEYSNVLTNIEIVHGWSDDVIPVEHAIKYAQQSQCSLHIIDGDHRLNSSLPQLIALFEVFLRRVTENTVANK